MLQPHDIELIRQAAHGDPFSVLGPHVLSSGRVSVRAFIPGAAQVLVVAASTQRVLATLARRHDDGFFERVLTARLQTPYQLHVRWADGSEVVLEDPYRFGPVLGDMDVWLLGEGTHLRPFEVLGARPATMDGVAGASFAVWAPNASRVSVVGDFNHWDGRRHPMRLRRECGVWEIFLPGVPEGARYKYEIRTGAGAVLPHRADPYALCAELRPATASVVAPLPAVTAPSVQRRNANALDAPVSIYEVHLGSWRRKPEEHNRWLDWDELADTLVPYAVDMGFTHLELLPISEHPFDGSWGYQPTGMYAPTARFGSPQGFRRFVQRCHAQGLGVLIDWVPAHFPTDAHGLEHFDGSHLYEHSDMREGYHPDWNTLIFNMGRTEVVNYLTSNALFWMGEYHIDCLRVDAVASMLYRDYSRKEGAWIPNKDGGRENWESVAFLKQVNELVYGEFPSALTVAEESTAWPGVSKPTFAGGLGFGFKWNMGWMHDTLEYMKLDPVHRKYHHNEMTFGLLYAFSENFILPLSHDEVVHGKGSLLDRMPGWGDDKFANLRAYYGFMWGHPGKKLLFMGCEFAQGAEWDYQKSLDWHQLEHPKHKGVQNLIRDLNAAYKDLPALHKRDCDGSGFDWIIGDAAQDSVFASIRYGDDGDAPVIVISNMTPVLRTSWRIGVPKAGRWVERINTDAAAYAGWNNGNNGGVVSQKVAAHGRDQSIELVLPPLSTLILEWKKS